MSAAMSRVLVALVVVPLVGVARADGPPEAGEPALPEHAARRLGVPAFRPGGEITGLAAVPDGKRVVVSGPQGVSLWDVETGRCCASAPAPAKLPTVRGVAPEAHKTGPVSSDGRSVALVWSGRLHRYPISLEGPPDVAPASSAAALVHAVAHLPADGSPVGLSVRGGLLGERATGFGKEKQVRWGGVVSHSVSGAVHFAVGGDLVTYAGDYAGARPTVFVYRHKDRNWQLVAALDAPAKLKALSLSGDGKWLAMIDGGENGKGLRVWKVGGKKEDFQEVRSWSAPPTGTIAMSTDGRVVAGASGDDGRVWLYDTEVGKELPALKAPGDRIRHLTFVPNRERLVGGGRNGVLYVWDARTGKPVGPSGGHTGAVRSIAYIAGGEAVTAGADGTVRIWDATGKERRTFGGYPAAVTAIPSPGGKSLFIAGLDGTVRVVDLDTGTERHKFVTGKPDGVGCLALSGDGRTLAAGTISGIIYLLAPDTLRAAKTLADDAGLVGGVGDLAFGPGGELVSRDGGKTTSVWDIDRGVETRRFAAPASGRGAARLVVSPGGKTVTGPLAVDGGMDTAAVDLGIWDIGTGKLLDRIQVGRRENELTALTYLPDGKAVAAGDAAGVVRVVDLEKKTVLHTFKGHRGPVLSLAPSPDGKTLSSGGADATVLVWKLDAPE